MASGVEGFLQGPEADAAAAQIGDDRDEVGQGAGEPVERGDDEGVAGAGLSGTQFGSPHRDKPVDQDPT